MTATNEQKVNFSSLQCYNSQNIIWTTKWMVKRAWQMVAPLL